ncbi:HAD domain-containing protein [Mucilaginibacter sp. PAMB04274]|uniref:HAD domain-containing protein n=1 Tax=Mucilaginibacter sp. PAMB04274 TaxID=3138568 RepID=UPI0031F70727
MLILLDIDGVMVPANSWRKPEFMEDGFPVFSFRSVKALQRIIVEMDASVLLTTSHKSQYSDSEWQRMLAVRGIRARNVQKLSTNSLEVSRLNEILEWYHHEHNHLERFVIIDDDKMLGNLPDNIKEHLVLTSPSVGLTDELADDAIAILKKRAIQYH